MKIQIMQGTNSDIDELEQLYNYLNDTLEQGINYPGWKRGVYPVRENAEAGIEQETLFVAKHLDKIVGSIILNHQPEEAYKEMEWKRP